MLYKLKYQRVINYSANTNYYDAIPSDYDGMMGMSLTYMDKAVLIFNVPEGADLSAMRLDVSR